MDLSVATMNEKEALTIMKAPGSQRDVKQGGCIQISVTQICDKSCFNCSAASNIKLPARFMSCENYEKACISLKDYFGIVGMTGGNSCIHPQFETLCDILCEHIPKKRRGLWTNNLNGHGKLCQETFSIFNLNAHIDERAYNEMSEWFPRRVILSESRHSPVYVAMMDVMDDEEKRWELISQCDVNKYWSPMICEVGTRLRAFFCQMAAYQCRLHQNDPSYPDLGLEVSPSWWDRPIDDFVDQIRFCCHRCGVPLKGYGQLAVNGEIEQVSQAHLSVYKIHPSKKLQLVTNLEDLDTGRIEYFTRYMENASK